MNINPEKDYIVCRIIFELLQSLISLVIIIICVISNIPILVNLTILYIIIYIFGIIVRIYFKKKYKIIDINLINQLKEKNTDEYRD